MNNINTVNTNKLKAVRGLTAPQLKIAIINLLFF